ncbi:MAG: hypothetical protein ACM3WV_08500 [Bacillota bacterium]
MALFAGSRERDLALARTLDALKNKYGEHVIHWSAAALYARKLDRRTESFVKIRMEEE